MSDSRATQSPLAEGSLSRHRAIRRGLRVQIRAGLHLRPGHHIRPGQQIRSAAFIAAAVTVLVAIIVILVM